MEVRLRMLRLYVVGRCSDLAAAAMTVRGRMLHLVNALSCRTRPNWYGTEPTWYHDGAIQTDFVPAHNVIWKTGVRHVGSGTLICKLHKRTACNRLSKPTRKPGTPHTGAPGSLLRRMR